MNPGPASALRIEQALRLLPPVEATGPLRAALLARARDDAGSALPYRTLGKRIIRAADLRDDLDTLMRESSEHLRGLYEAYIDALEANERGDLPAAVARLREAGLREEGVGRLSQARSWYEAAGVVAADLRDRRPEIETLVHLGRLSATLGRYLDAARHFQRALVLAEAEFDRTHAIQACDGLGRMATAKGEWIGAQAWHTRALRLAEEGDDRDVTGRQLHRLAALALRRGDLAAVTAPLQKAMASFEADDNAVEMASCLRTQGLLDSRLGRSANALAAYREALAWAARAPAASAADLATRLDLAELHLSLGRYLEAEEELRRTEQLAIERRDVRWAIRAYALMGRLRGQQHDQAGFVFFEEALRLCRGIEVSPAAEARLYRQYGEFCLALGLHDEARAYLERARHMFDELGQVPDRDQVRAELQQISA